MAYKRPRARLVLEDGTEFEGIAFGATDRHKSGELGTCETDIFRKQ